MKDLLRCAVPLLVLVAIGVVAWALDLAESVVWWPGKDDWRDLG